MLVEFKVENFRSFDDEQVLSFVAREDERLAGLLQREDVTGRKELSLLPSLYVYGANASGKSNLCEAVKTFRRSIVESAYGLSEGMEIPDIMPFRLRDEKRTSASSSFEATLDIDGDLWRYGFAATRTQIDREWLFVQRQGIDSEEIALLEREGQDAGRWWFSDAVSWPKDILRDRTRPSNGLVLSKAAQENVGVIRSLYRYFLSRLSTIDLAQNPFLLVQRIIEAADEDASLQAFLSHAAKTADVGLEGLMILGKDPAYGTPHETRVPGYQPAIDLIVNGYESKRLTTFRLRPDGNQAQFGFLDESSGTQRFLVVAFLLYNAWKNRQTVFIDEIESSLHPLLAQALQSLVNDLDLTPLGAQFVFATHDTNLLDAERVRSDQIVLAEKGPHGATQLTSLYDSPDRPRPDAALERQYLNGKFGGVPVLGNLRDAFLNAVYPVKAPE